MRHKVDTTEIKKEDDWFYDDTHFKDEDLDVLINEKFKYLEDQALYNIQDSVDDYFHEEDFKNIRKYNKEGRYFKEFYDRVKLKTKSLDRAISIYNYLVFKGLSKLFNYGIQKREVEFYYLDNTNLEIHIDDFYEICFKIEEVARLIRDVEHVHKKGIAMQHFNNKHGEDESRDKKIARVNFILEGFIRLKMFDIDSFYLMKEEKE